MRALNRVLFALVAIVQLSGTVGQNCTRPLNILVAAISNPTFYTGRGFPPCAFMEARKVAELVVTAAAKQVTAMVEAAMAKAMAEAVKAVKAVVMTVVMTVETAVGMAAATGVATGVANGGRCRVE